VLSPELFTLVGLQPVGIVGRCQGARNALVTLVSAMLAARHRLTVELGRFPAFPDAQIPHT
jgi:hypothetical protein